MASWPFILLLAGHFSKPEALSLSYDPCECGVAYPWAVWRLFFWPLLFPTFKFSLVLWQKLSSKRIIQIKGVSFVKSNWRQWLFVCRVKYDARFSGTGSAIIKQTKVNRDRAVFIRIGNSVLGFSLRSCLFNGNMAFCSTVVF